MEDKMVTISVKIPKSLKNRIKKSDIKVSTAVRRFLERKILIAEARKLEEELKRHKRIFEKISIDDVVATIREDRRRVM
jgi:hypothetical protein